MIRPGSLFAKSAQRREELRRAGILTGAGITGLVPALVLVGGGLTGQHVPSVLIYPALVLGGLAVSLAASFVAVTHWEFLNERGFFRLECTIRKRAADLVVLGTSLVLLGIIAGYLFRENFEPR